MILVPIAIPPVVPFIEFADRVDVCLGVDYGEVSFA